MGIRSHAARQAGRKSPSQAAKDRTPKPKRTGKRPPKGKPRTRFPRGNKSSKDPRKKPITGGRKRRGTDANKGKGRHTNRSGRSMRS